MKPARHILVPEAAKNSLVLLDSEKLKHLRKVLRMEWGELVRVADGHGRLFDGSLETSLEGDGIRLGALVRQEDPPMALELVVGMPKNSTMDWIVEKAVECGVGSIQPVITSRSVVRPEDREKYVNRWQAIMDGAVEQSEGLWRPQVREPLTWKKWIVAPSSSTSLAFVSEQRQKKSDAEAMKETWVALTHAMSHPIRVMIGPEGGFSDEEAKDLVRVGFTCLSLGNTVLRVETAVISILTLVRASRLVSSCFVLKP